MAKRPKPSTRPKPSLPNVGKGAKTRTGKSKSWTGSC